MILIEISVLIIIFDPYNANEKASHNKSVTMSIIQFTLDLLLAITHDTKVCLSLININ